MKPSSLPPNPCRDYRDPQTGLGIPLSNAGCGTAPDFLLHECGCMRYENWNHRGILSPYWRLHYNFASGNHLTSNGRTFALDAAHAILTPAGVQIDTFGPKAPLHSWIHFSWTRSFHLRLRDPISLVLSPALRALYGELAEAVPQAAEPTGKLRLLHLCQALIHTAFAGLDPASFQSYPPALAALLARVETHPQELHSNLHLAQFAGMSVSRFVPWFKSHTGLTPARYVQKVRLRLAAGQLCYSDSSIEQIAAECGFANRFHFSRLFQAETGRGPAAYRRTQRPG